jgi:hypothetical protein
MRAGAIRMSHVDNYSKCWAVDVSVGSVKIADRHRAVVDGVVAAVGGDPKAKPVAYESNPGPKRMREDRAMCLSPNPRVDVRSISSRQLLNSAVQGIGQSFFATFDRRRVRIITPVVVFCDDRMDDQWIETRDWRVLGLGLDRAALSAEESEAAPSRGRGTIQ